MELGQHGPEVSDLVGTFYQLYIRSRRRAKALRFYVVHIENREAWAPFVGIEDLGSAVPGTLLFQRKPRVSKQTCFMSEPPSRPLKGPFR